jgi:hypothetical protein
VLKTRSLEKAGLLLPPVASDAYLRLGFACLLAAFQQLQGRDDLRGTTAG